MTTLSLQVCAVICPLGQAETAMAGDFGTVPAEYEFLDPENVERAEKLRETIQVTIGDQEVFKWNDFDRNIISCSICINYLFNPIRR